MTTPREADLQALRAFLDTPLDVRLARAAAADPEAHALGLAQRVAAGVPAYAAFLRDHAVDPVAATRLADLPLKTKPGYVRAFPLADRARGGDLAASAMLAVSSGSTGEPVVWPRALRDELEVASRFEQVLRDAFHADARTTLAVVCFPLGTWVGGMFTAACLRHLALKGYPLTVATPGNKPDEILRVVADLRDDFDQTVLLGYPPFMKDVVDLGRERGLDWAARPTRLVFAGEVFSEAWRDLVCARVGADDPATATASLYGTADSGVLAVETPLSIAVRRFFAAHPDAARDTFGEARLPTLAQYDPLDRYFEVVPGELGDTLALTA
ncbi:MAG: phenylacetate--CoA ligase family protein, partial [Myxococcales bacterium]|nr:phenylacetate--CoA ligase family protein [Myxococcales bacterium]